MKINPVVLQLQQWCPVFAGRVAGGVDFDAARASHQVDPPGAFVIATGDHASDNDLANSIRQNISDGFDVMVILDATEQGAQLAADVLHDIRAQLWRALVGWKPAAEYDPITYAGGVLVQIDRALVIYRYSFASIFQLGRNTDTDPAETWQELEQDGLPRLEGFDINVDCLDPADHNLKHPGPDGRIEVQLKEDLP
ncbi:hypothetical protein [Pseudomonas sp. RIT-PI-S]|uniref:phage tail terminator protein n=1 Tax=Pseudomonas sp. RIT-PI-S TaxID=3035295 RepID=UPI0021DAC607|nr:hypothetical protein [Pseudomonas sp. RIT-PI-S]